MGMHRLGRRRSTEKPGSLRISFLIGFLGKGKIFTVGLGFTGKCIF
jgi:hypothetical protein